VTHWRKYLVFERERERLKAINFCYVIIVRAKSGDELRFINSEDSAAMFLSIYYCYYYYYY
jgi:hypothetical protein